MGCKGVGERERERNFIDNQELTEGLSPAPCRVTPPLGARGPAYEREKERERERERESLKNNTLILGAPGRR